MNEAIIVALIAGTATVIAQIVIAQKNSKELYSKIDKQSELSDERIWSELRVIKSELTGLARDVREHNNFARRTPVLEEQMKNVQKEIENIKNRAS